MTSEEIQQAQAIITGWFWQAAEGHNYRWSKAVRSFTRYYESAPMEPDMLRLVVEYLRTQTEVAGIELNHKLLTYPDVTWQAKDAWFETVGDKWEGTQSTKVRIYQTLISQTDGTADGPFIVEDGCKYKVTHWLYWDVGELPTLPASSSGIEYTIEGISRNRETGLLSCAVVKRERVQQDIALYVSDLTKFEKGERELHLGVKAADVAGTGQQASAGGGVLVERQLSKNEDCTTNIENKKTTEIAAANATKVYSKTLRGTKTTTLNRNQAAALDGTNLTIGETRRSELTPGGLYNNTTEVTGTEAAGKVTATCQKTVFQHEHQEVVNQLAAPTSDEVSSAAGGVINTQTSRRTEEGTYDVTTGTTTEIAAANATKIYSKTLRGTKTTTLNRNQAAALDGTNLTIGETRRSELTPGGLYNNTTEVTGTEAAGKINATCQTTVFQHEHQEVVNQLAAPTSDEVSSASGGVINTQTSRRTEEGTYDVTTGTTTEIAAANATKIYTNNRLGDGSADVGWDHPAALTGTGLTIGETRRSELTPGGLYNNTTEVTGTEAAGKVTATCQKTVFQHEHQEVVNQLAAPTSDDVASASGGVINTQTSRRTEEGTYDVTTGTTTEIAAANATKIYTKTLRGTKTTTVDRNQATALTGAGLTIGETRRSELTPGGLYNNTTEVTGTEAAGQIVGACQVTSSVHSDSTVTNSLSASWPHPKTPAVNQVLRTQVRKTEEGTYDVQDDTTTYSPVEKVLTWSDDDWYYQLVQYKNQTAPLTQATAGAMTDPESKSCSFAINDHGTYDGSVVLRKANPGEGTATPAFIKDISYTIDQVYVKPGGKMFKRAWTITGKVYGGLFNVVLNHVYETGHKDFPHLGLRSHVSGGGNNAIGYRYTSATAGAEELVEQEVP